MKDSASHKPPWTASKKNSLACSFAQNLSPKTETETYEASKDDSVTYSFVAPSAHCGPCIYNAAPVRSNKFASLDMTVILHVSCNKPFR